jgi:hypothetical protein
MAAASNAERFLKVVKNTETKPQTGASTADAADIPAAIEQLRAQNEYIIALLQDQARKFQASSNVTTNIQSLTSGVSIGPNTVVWGSVHVYSPFYNIGVAAPDTGFVINTSSFRVLSTAPEEVEVPARAITEDLPSGAPSQFRRGIPLPILLELSALFVGTACVGSLAVWLAGSSPPLNPFVSLLALIASPFFFAMGRLARRELS